MHTLDREFELEPWGNGHELLAMTPKLTTVKRAVVARPSIQRQRSWNYLLNSTHSNKNLHLTTSKINLQLTNQQPIVRQSKLPSINSYSIKIRKHSNQNYNSNKGIVLQRKIFLLQRGLSIPCYRK